jgi:hypothetical protein
MSSESTGGSIYAKHAPMSENHIRSISTTLSLLDKALCEFEQWAQGHEIRSVLYEVRNTLSDTQRESIAVEIAEMKDILEEVRSNLNLEVTTRYVDKIFLGSCSILWTYLMELEGRHLNRYGEVPPGLAKYLDPQVDALNERLRSIGEIVARKGHAEVGPGENFGRE